MGMTDGPVKLEPDGFVQSTWNRYRSSARPQSVLSNPTRYSGDPAGGGVHPVAPAGSMPIDDDDGVSRYTMCASCPESIAARSKTATPTPAHVPSPRNWFIVM